MLVHCNLIMMTDINQMPVLCPHTNKTTNISYSRQSSGRQSPLKTKVDSLCTAIKAHKKDAMANLASLL